MQQISRRNSSTSAPVTVDAAACCVPECDRDAEQDSPFPICLPHARTAFAFYVRHTEDIDDSRPVKPVRPIREKVGRVYFIRRGEMVKIGWSQAPERRLSSLNGDALLYHTVGTMRDEALLHRAFEVYRVPNMGREWFWLNDDLAGFIELLRNYRAEVA